MKVVRVLFLITFGAFLSACSLFMPQEEVCVARRVSADYIMTGTVENIRAYLYGNRTVLELDTSSSPSLFVTDEMGAFVAYEKIGQLYRLARRLDSFNVRVNHQLARFVATTPLMSVAAPAKTVVESAKPVVAVVAATKPVPVVVKPVVTKPSDNDALVIAQLLALSEKQLQTMRQTSAIIIKKSHQPQSKGKKSNSNTLNARIDKMEARFLSASSANIQVHFSPASALFKPNPEVSKVLLASARIAQHITVRGYADVSVAGRANAKLSLSRALAVRTFLMSQGIPSEKIKVFAQVDGEGAVSNLTQEGKAFNRRVEIELVHPLIAELKSKNKLSNKGMKLPKDIKK